jgi:putative SOS response-associated peptidase YedK
MCYSIAQVLKARDLEERFPARFINAERYQPFYYVSAFDRPSVPVIASDEASSIQLFQWGLVPYWVEDGAGADEISLKTLNARLETIFEKPAFRQSARERHCIILVSGFFEWHESCGRKYPYYIWLKDRQAFALAGIWDNWVERTSGEVRRTFSVLTTRANSLIEEIHNTKKRMPVILPPGEEMEWLRVGKTESECSKYLKSFPSESMLAHPVTRSITRYGQAVPGPEAICHMEYPELPALKNLH